MKDWSKTLIPPTATIREAIAVIDASSAQICLVVDEERRLLGTMTDGDIRRAILRGVDLSAPAKDIMNRNPTVANEATSPDEILAKMKPELLHQMPILDGDGRLVGLETIDHLMADSCLDTWVVLMAGGFGHRLRPLTEDTPKPMLPVGGRPLLQIILENFIGQGFRRFYISVNYKAERIKEHFGDGAAWEAEIRYLHEDRELGTVGALSLIEEPPTEPLLVMNGDLLTNVDFRNLLTFHRQQKSAATICVREVDMEVPFGVVEIDEERIASIDEKPVHRFLVNAGIYLFDPPILSLIPKGQRFEIPELFDKILRDGHNTAMFPIREYWLDVGRIDQYRQANGDIVDLFRRETQPREPRIRKELPT